MTARTYPVTAEMTPQQRVEQGLREAIDMLDRRRLLIFRRPVSQAELWRLQALLHSNIPPQEH
jgi:hypothetical protein